MNEAKTQVINFKVLIADDDSNSSKRLADFLRERGFGVDHVANGRLLKDRVKSFKPHFVICDLTLSDMNAPQFLKWLKDPEIKDQRPKVIVVSAHNVISNIRECISLGASDYVVKPLKPEDILTRLVFHIQNKRELLTDSRAAQNKLEGADIYLHLLDIVLREALSGRQNEDVLFNMTKMVAITLKAVRCSIVMVAEDLQTGQVMVSSDDRSVRGIKLDMNKYPEILHVVNTDKSIVIEDLEYDPMLAQIKNLVKGISFNSMIVCPLKQNQKIYGVISARMDRNHSRFNERDIRFVQLVSQIISIFLSSNINLPHELLKLKSA